MGRRMETGTKEKTNGIARLFRLIEITQKLESKTVSLICPAVGMTLINSLISSGLSAPSL